MKDRTKVRLVSKWQEEKKAGGERQGEDVCVCRDDRGNDRYWESVTEEGDRIMHQCKRSDVHVWLFSEIQWDTCNNLLSVFGEEDCVPFSSSTLGIFLLNKCAAAKQLSHHYRRQGCVLLFLLLVISFFLPFTSWQWISWVHLTEARECNTRVPFCILL